MGFTLFLFLTDLEHTKSDFKRLEINAAVGLTVCLIFSSVGSQAFPSLLFHPTY
jgi:hypothetical protein